MRGSPEQVRLLLGFEATDWLLLVGGVALSAVFAAIFVF
jgi:hypothetical protein